MWLSAFLLSSTLLLVDARAGLFDAPFATLDIFKTSSKGSNSPQFIGWTSEKESPTPQPSCRDNPAYRNGKCTSNSNLPPHQINDALDTLNIEGAVGIPFTPLEAKTGVSLNPTNINFSTRLDNKNDLPNKESDPAVSEYQNSWEQDRNNITDRIADTYNEAVCLETVTEVNGKPSCKGKLVFEENFDVLDHNRWQHVVQFAGAPDYEFVTYSNDEKNSYVSNGKLHIKPTLLSDEGIDITTATLELQGCTATHGSTECRKRAMGRNILPPIKSARLRTKESFSFRYGQFEVQAKLPAGDWIFPEIWLEPKENTYGSNRFESGLIQLAFVRGNRNLILNNKDIGARHFTASATMGIGKAVHSETFSSDSTGLWCNDFHTYTVTWTPDNITFRVDGKEIGRVTPPDEGFKKLGPFSDLEVPWTRGSKIAPYDREFFISIGVGAGGFRAFPDNGISSNHTKPWKNMNVKAMLHFWEDKDSWFPSWSEDSSTLQVEHVKIWAL